MQRISEQQPELQLNRVYLRGVDLFLLLQTYLEGKFADLRTPIQPSVKTGQSQSVVEITTNNYSKSYRLCLGSGQYFACLGYKVYDTKGHYGPLDPEYLDNYNCMYCLKPFEDLENKSEIMGIPIRRTLVKEVVHYHMVDIFCCMRCMYAEYKRRQGNQLYSQSMQLISEIYQKYSGKDPSMLQPSSDPRLLQIFNGPMTWDQYHENDEIYQEIPGNVFFVPTLEYLGQSS